MTFAGGPSDGTTTEQSGALSPTSKPIRRASQNRSTGLPRRVLSQDRCEIRADGLGLGEVEQAEDWQGAEPPINLSQ